MTLKKSLFTAGIIAVIGVGTSATAFAHGSATPCNMVACGWHQGGHMGPGMMDQGYGMGPGMTGQGHGMGPGMMGRGYGMGPGMMGQGYGMGPGMMGQGYGMGSGMMGQGHGMGPGMMGHGYGMGPGMMQPLRQDLSVENVQHMMEHRLAWQGNRNVKVGKVEEKSDDIIIAEIVTQDGSLVQRLEVDRHTGRMQPAQ